METGKAKIDVETCELILKFNKEKVVFKVYDWTPYVEDLDTCYYLEKKGNKVDKGMKKMNLPCEGLPFAWHALGVIRQANDGK